MLTLRYGFGSVVTLEMAGVPYPAVGVIVIADVEVKWMSKVLSLDADLARFDSIVADRAVTLERID